MSISIFFSYSHKDEALRDKVAEHLSALKRSNVIQEWHDRQIPPGSEWKDEIDCNLRTADIILLLISSSFIASDYCYGVELDQAMRHHDTGKACVIPVILRPVDWQGTPFGGLQALPKNARPVTKWENEDEALMDVAQGIRLAAERIAQRKREYQSPLLTNDIETQRIKESEPGEASYRQEVIECVQEGIGEISAANRIFLESFRSSLALSPEQAALIEQSVLHPFQTYAQTLEGMVQQQFPLTETSQTRLKRLQVMLVLSDENVAALQQKVLAPYYEEVLSDKGIDYIPLRNMLKKGQWQDADEETFRVMCAVTGREKEKWLREEDLRQFPSQDLRTIDRLWRKHSGGRFGFSVQKRIWQECGSPTKYGEDWNRFGDRVGWLKSRSYQTREGTSGTSVSGGQSSGFHPAYFHLAYVARKETRLLELELLKMRMPKRSFFDYFYNSKLANQKNLSEEDRNTLSYLRIFFSHAGLR
ncbi:MULTISPECIES: GUN4 domain-containing protein [Leptolyngbya]|uniref:GUN4 domain-containing protein n=1 Tax=Leptolyngbya TaxID=47251 RepID=UPI0016890675|nr:GUN4 domain-containing protein [Leptolyngbya sp. FACHB-1624]MBD1856852.1 GUN4 domain-containing protein [Leptolyngbya sp. FACHB-1624]